MIKKILSVIVSAVTIASFIPQVPAKADEIESYPYTLFAGSNEEGALTINSNNVCINGNIATNGTISTTAQYFNVNGMRKENAQEEVKIFFNKIDSRYFKSYVETYLEDYSLEDTNINVNIPIEVNGNIDLTGNINITSGIKALNDVKFNGNVENTQDSVICSKTGDITINTDNLNLNGLVYAPNGSVNITAQNLNLNSVIIIADTITITCPNLNANYNAQMAEFIGNESEPVIHNEDDDTELEIVAYSDYDDEDEKFTIYWNTTVPDGTFDILSSDDGENYTSIGTVIDDDSYKYTFTEPFDKKYIKVKETTKSGKVCESLPFVVSCIENGYDIEVLDSDKDGLPDIYELKIGTDINKIDTDEDGLTDYQEYVYTNTDPLVYDSVIEGTSDADIDTDEDGLSNINEFTRETYPWTPDTDNDGLSDYDEIFVYNTDPLVVDSDEDGVDDGSEIKLGLDPNDPATNGVPDGEYVIPQSIEADSEILSSVNTDASPYELSIDIKTNGDAEKELTVDESGYSAVIENDAMIGASIDVEIADACNPEEIVLKYKINDAYTNNDPDVYSGNEKFEGIKRLAVFKYFDDVNAMFPLYTEYDVSSNTISVNVEDGGTYCLIDTEKWFSNLGIDLTSTNANTSSQPLRLNAPKALAAENSVNASNSTQKIGKGAFGYIFENKPVDLIFMIQNCGSDTEWQKENFEFEKKLIHDISAYTFKTYKDVSVHIVPYGHTITGATELNNGFPTENDLAEVDSVLRKIEYFTQSSVAKRNDCYKYAVSNLKQSNYRNSKKLVYNFINGETSLNIESDLYYDYQWVYKWFWFNDIVFSEIKYNDDNFDIYLHNYIVGKTNNITDASIRKQISNNTGVDLTLDTTSNSNYNDIIRNIQRYVIMTPLHGGYSPIDWKPIILNGELNSQNGIDTDGDCLTDWEETDVDKLIKYDDGSFDLPTMRDYISKIENTSYRESIVRFIEGKLSNAANSSVNGRTFAPTNKSNTTATSFYNIHVLSYNSDLINKDRDGDGYTDLEDPDPLKSPDIIGKEYNCLDNEIYYLRAIETSTIDPNKGDFSNKDYLSMKNGSNTPGTSIILNAINIEKDDFKFRFEWCGDGYKIHSILNENLVLTADISTKTVSMQLDKNLTRQKWEVVPYKNKKYCFETNNVDGILFRCKETEKNNQRFIPLYLNYSDGILKISNDRNNNTCFYPEEIGNWNKFGKIYMIYSGWFSYASDDIKRAMKNYEHNSSIGVREKTNPQYIDQTKKIYVDNNSKELRSVKEKSSLKYEFSNIYNELGTESCNCIGNYKLLYDQYGGNFPKMIFVNADSSKKMDYSCCEIMATFNLLSVAGCYDIKDSSGNITNDLNQYSKLVLEFELSDLMFGQSIQTGRWGSKPYGIKRCLDAYNINSTDYGAFKSDISTLENEIKNNKGFAIISTIEIPGPVHTFFVFYDPSTSEFVGVNRYSNSLHGWRVKSLKELVRTEDNDALFGGHVLL